MVVQERKERDYSYILRPKPLILWTYSGKSKLELSIPNMSLVSSWMNPSSLCSQVVSIAGGRQINCPFAECKRPFTRLVVRVETYGSPFDRCSDILQLASTQPSDLAELLPGPYVLEGNVKTLES